MLCFVCDTGWADGEDGNGLHITPRNHLGVDGSRIAMVLSLLAAATTTTTVQHLLQD